MRVKKGAEPRDSDGASDQKQDPLERRRLQNRLSQRNHRRKIRDRIAKLQERVIANELRAAAALNGWDQPYSPPPLLGTRHAFQQDSGLGNSIPDTPLSVTEPFSSFGSYCGSAMASPWPSAVGQSSTLLSEDPTWLWNTDTQYPNSDFGDLVSDGANQPFLMTSEDHTMPDISSAGSPNSSASFAAQVSQPLYYAVTESALPQILQFLSSASPQSKIIVLVSPDAVSASSLIGNSGLQDLSQQISNAQSTICQCQSQSSMSALTASMSSRAWANPATSYLNGCPSKINNTVGGGLSSARL